MYTQMIAQTMPNVQDSGILIACFVVVLKCVLDFKFNRAGKDGKVCGITPADNLLIMQTHTLSVENNKILLRHFDEVGNISGSIKDLIQSINDSRIEDAKIQKKQTEILERLTDAVSRT